MPRDRQVLIYVGIKDVVIAIDDRTGAEVWRTQLKSSDYVSVLWDGESLIAAARGEVWRLDPRTGTALWHNEMKGLGWGIVSLASTRLPTANMAPEALAAAKRQQDAQAAAG